MENEKLIAWFKETHKEVYKAGGNPFGFVDKMSEELIDQMYRNDLYITYKEGNSWKCPLGRVDCKKNCGDYGCGN